MSDIRKIQTLAPLLAYNFIDIDDPIALEGYEEYLQENSEYLGKFQKYLSGKLHDSWITEVEIDPEKLRLQLNEFTTHVFSDAIVEKFKIDIEHDKLVFPLILELTGDLNIDFLRVEENGALKSIDQISVDEYLGEQILKLNDDHYEIAFELWHDNPNEDMQGERVLVIVSAKEFKLTEEQDKAWNEIFGDKYDDYYEYFRQQFESGRYVSDYGICLQLVDEFDGKIKKPNAQHSV